MTAQHNLAITRGPSSFKPPAMRFGGWSFSGSAAACATRACSCATIGCPKRYKTAWACVVKATAGSDRSARRRQRCGLVGGRDDRAPRGRRRRRRRWDLLKNFRVGGLQLGDFPRHLVLTGGELLDALL